MSHFTVVYPGTFDPLTNGHLDLIGRGAKIADALVIAVLRSSTKPEALFSVEERVDMLQEATAGYRNVSVLEFDGLLMDFARAQGAQAVLRGIRAVSDYEYELQMALMKKPKLNNLQIPKRKRKMLNRMSQKDLPLVLNLNWKRERLLKGWSIYCYECFAVSLKTSTCHSFIFCFILMYNYIHFSQKK